MPRSRSRSPDRHRSSRRRSRSPDRHDRRDRHERDSRHDSRHDHHDKRSTHRSRSPERRKRSRSPPREAPPAKKPTTIEDDAARRQRAAELEASLASTLASLGIPGLPSSAPSATTSAAAAATAAATVATPAAPTRAPVLASAAALRMDDRGRVVDQTGAVVKQEESVATLMANKRPKIEAEAPPKRHNPYWQADTKSALKNKHNRPRRDLVFAEAGKFIEQAEQHRAVAILKETLGDAKTAAPREDKDVFMGDVNQIELGDRARVMGAPVAPPVVVPDIEWWDAPLLTNHSYKDVRLTPNDRALNDDDLRRIDLVLKKMTILVEHPIPIQPPGDNSAPAARPAMLTQKEQAKLRKATRREAQKEKQDLIRSGLMPPPPNKVKISNLMRVLTTEALMDPTRIEAEVRTQMDERRQEHDKANAERKLTASERRKKKIKKLCGNLTSAVQVAVFRIWDTSNKSCMWKVFKNCIQNHCSGVTIVTGTPGLNIFICEGPPKCLSRIRKLLEKRIKWTAKERPPRSKDGSAPAAAAGADDDEPEERETDEKRARLVWQGDVMQAQFVQYKLEEFQSEGAARAFLRNNNCEQYLDMAKNWTDED
eukprot:TRINITY_DN9206_c0_g1_i1.p1 TRINITY_DN9206_c0_g1~~TRINITY_DN9206_c0_g1_i1.p1  ORF type:complete len:598 (-),score=155.96 TRINITY_DN9206_c0_g1_i1:47-1840(-)